MGAEQMDFAAILANLEAKRAALDATIASIRLAMATGVLGQGGDVPPGSGGSIYSSSGAGGEVPAGAFFGKSIPDAAKLYMEIVKKKQTSREISEALHKGGMETNARNFPQMVHSVLDRARKAGNSGIVKLDRSHWGLAAWYPSGLIRTNGTPEKRVVKKKGYKAKSAKVAPKIEERKEKPIDRALRFLETNRSTEHSLAEIANHVSMGPKGARLLLSHLLKSRKIHMNASGMYTASIPLRLAEAS